MQGCCVWAIPGDHADHMGKEKHCPALSLHLESWLRMVLSAVAMMCRLSCSLEMTRAMWESGLPGHGGLSLSLLHLDPQVHVGGSLAVLGGKLYVSGGYDNTFELSDVVEAYDPETQAWSVVGWLPEPTFWHGSVSIFSQFMPQTPAGGHGFELNSGSSGVDAGHHRLPQSPEELH